LRHRRSILGGAAAGDLAGCSVRQPAGRDGGASRGSGAENAAHVAGSTSLTVSENVQRCRLSRGSRRRSRTRMNQSRSKPGQYAHGHLVCCL